MTELDEGAQLAFPATAVRNRGLLSEHFLMDRLPLWPEFQSADVAGLHQRLEALWSAEQATLDGRNEAQTEDRFIQPVLQALGFSYTVQADLKFATGRRQPDYALFASDEHRETADHLEGEARYEHAVAVADAKRWDRPLDDRSPGSSGTADPVAQIINYLLITKREWGVLTNGRLWRLYAARGRLTEGACLEIDLIQLLESGDPADLRWFMAFFGAEALTPGHDGTALVGRALDESRANAVQVGDALERQVFNAVPLIAEGLLGEESRTDEALAAAFDHALVLLYRLLFCLYAEARGLLPLGNTHYRGYSLHHQKTELAKDVERERVFSARSEDLYNDLRGLFRIVDKGDDGLGVTEYNGGLFSAGKHPYFTGRGVPDRLLAPALDLLYRVDGDFVDYQDLSVRHLGTIYERLLDFRLAEEEGEGLMLEPASGRHESGSYFTPAHIVDAIVERTLTPLLERRSSAAGQAGFTGAEALDELLRVRVVDPAMGSGHFLVAAAEYMAQHIASDPAFDGDLDLSEVRRLVAERCLYGVDLNPMAVELAQLSLWLSTVRRDEPLTFLGNLRCGNSLVGVDIDNLVKDEDTLFEDQLTGDMEKIVGALDEIVSQPSDSGAAVREKERLASVADALRGPLAEHADLTLAPRFDGDPGFFHWQIEFPEVFLGVDGDAGSDSGFDAVIGNPPYVRIQELGRELAAYCRTAYRWPAGSFDVYLPFIERAVGLLGPDGRLGFIVPNKWLKLDYGKRMREAMSADGLVEEIVDFGDAQVFEGATNYTCILLLGTGGDEKLAYRRVRGGEADVRIASSNLDAVGSEQFSTRELGGGPWVLATGAEARILKRARRDAASLAEVTEQIFTGLQTSADPVYIVEDRGRRGSNRIVYSKASDREFEVEPDLLKPLASGGEVDRYAFRPLTSLLLFPYRRDEDRMRLLEAAELAALPLTEGYLTEHEEVLRQRESGKMNHNGWYGYVYPKSLGAHDSPKLGVPRLCARLRASADSQGGVYLDNVDVNGILISDDAPSLSVLAVLLNSRLLDWLFRRGSVPFRGDFFSANKQFIAPLPIREPIAGDGERLGSLGKDLHAAMDAINVERKGFLDWLEAFGGARIAALAGVRALRGYDSRSVDEVLAILASNRGRLEEDPRSRTFREQVSKELEESLDRLQPLKRSLAKNERLADRLVYDLYEMTENDRRLIDEEYE